MIQRRQTIYLFLIVLVIIGMLSFDSVFYTASGTVADEGENIEQVVNVGFRTVRTEVGPVGRLNGLVYLEVVVGLLALVTIFLYKNRPLQLRLSVIGLVLVLGLFVLMYMYSYNMEYLDNPAKQTLQYPALIPLSIIILYYLSVRRIRADELLVKSLDRLR